MAALVDAVRLRPRLTAGSPGPRAPRPDDTPLAAGTTLTLDPRTRVLDAGRILVGGSPIRVLRLSRRGCEVVGGWLSGEGVSTRRGEQLLARRLWWLGLVHPEPFGATTSTRDVTVVVPVRDRPKQLEDLLARLGDVPTIVVDDGSLQPDAVAAVATASGASVVALPDRRGPAAARNAGLLHVRTPLVAFVDSDCLPHPGWLETLLAHFDDPLVGAAAPRLVAGGPRSGSWIRSYEHARPPLDRGDRPGLVRPRTRIPFAPTAALVVRRDVAGDRPFDESLRTGEDVDFVWRLVEAGWAVRYEPRALVAHPPRDGTRAWLAQRAGYGAAAGPLANRHPGNLAPASLPALTVAAVAAGVSGRPVAAAGVTTVAVGLLARRLAGTVDRPLATAARLVAEGATEGTRAAVAGLARAWGPALVLGLAIRRTRRAAAAVLALPALDDWARTGSGPGTGAGSVAGYLLAHVLDDVAYGAGVWAGCARARTLRPVLPEITFGRAGATQTPANRTTPRTFRPAARSS